MQINLSQIEAHAACQTYFDRITGQSTTVHIESPPREGRALVLMDAVATVKRYRFKSDEKIAAIQALREWSLNYGPMMGLVDAKNFVGSLA